MFSKFSTDAIAGGSRMLRTAYGHYDIELTFTGNNRFACWNPSCKYPSYYTARFKIRDWSWDWPRGYARILQHKGKRQQKEQHTWQPYTQHGTQTMKTVVMSVQARYQVDGASERQVHSTPESQSREVQRHPGMRMRVRIVFNIIALFMTSQSAYIYRISVASRAWFLYHANREFEYEYTSGGRWKDSSSGYYLYSLLWMEVIYCLWDFQQGTVTCTLLHALPIVSIAIWHI